jgi:hypothetical protein
MLKNDYHFILGGGLVKVFSPKVEYYIDIIKNKNLYFIKMNHAWWQLLAGKEFWKVKFKKCHDKELIDEVKEIIKNIDKTDIVLAVNDDDPYQTNKKIHKELNEIIIKSIPENYQPHFGWIWKKYVLNKTIDKFFDHIKNNEVIVVGFDHLKELETTLKFTNFNFYQLFFDSSRNEKRLEVLDDLLKIVNVSGKKCVLIQAGELFSSWLVYNLRFKTTNQECSFIDMGRSLDKFCPNRIYSDDIKKFDLSDFKNQAWMSRKI